MPIWKTTAMAIFSSVDQDLGDGTMLCECITIPEGGTAVRLTSLIPNAAFDGGEPALLQAWSDKHKSETVQLKPASFIEQITEFSREHPQMSLVLGTSFMSEAKGYYLSIVKAPIAGKQWVASALHFSKTGEAVHADHKHVTLGLYDQFHQALDAAEAFSSQQEIARAQDNIES